MWRTELAGLPEIANPLSLEMSCEAWPRTSQTSTNHPPRSQALSLQYCLLSCLCLPGISYYWGESHGEYNVGNSFISALFIQLWVLLSCAVKARGYGPFSFSAILYCSCTTPQCLVKAWIWHLETATLNNYHIRFIHPKCIYVVWLCYKQQTNRELLTLSATAATQASIFLC